MADENLVDNTSSKKNKFLQSLEDNWKTISTIIAIVIIGYSAGGYFTKNEYERKLLEAKIESNTEKQDLKFELEACKSDIKYLQFKIDGQKNSLKNGK